MNPLPTIRKNIASIEDAFKSIKSQQTKDAAHEMVHRFYSGLFGPRAGETETVAVEPPQVIATDLGYVQIPAAVETLVNAAETPPVGLPEVYGDLPGATGTFYVETVVPEPGATVECLQGWPLVDRVIVKGMAPNRRSMKGQLAWNGKTVSLERHPGIQPGDIVRAKLIRAGVYPMYRKVP